MTTAYIFPGQGSQAIGMGKSLAEAFPTAKHTLQEVDDALNQNLSKIMFEGDEAALTLTENTQPAIMAASIAVVRVLEEQSGQAIEGSFVAGHSLGEYSALCAAKAISLADTAKLLKIRGQAMQAAVPVGEGAMAAILGLDIETVEAICKEHECVIANDNANGQVVISGIAAAINNAIELAKAKGAKRSVLLNVSAPFHSPLMEPAAQRMLEALAETEIKSPTPTLVANVTASAVTDPAKIRELLVQQVTGRVRWRESIEYMAAQGVIKLIECGHGKVLSGLTRRINRDIATQNIQEPADFDVVLKAA